MNSQKHSLDLRQVESQVNSRLRAQNPPLEVQKSLQDWPVLGPFSPRESDDFNMV